MKTPNLLSPSALHFLRTAHEGAKLNFSELQFERDGLQRLADSLARKSPSIDASPLEAPYGLGGVLRQGLQRLKASPLRFHCEASIDPALIDRLLATQARAMYSFAGFRFPDLPIDAATGHRLGLPTGQRQRLPAAVHREARRLYAELSNPLRFEASKAPDLATLQQASIWAREPLDEAHVPALASILCVAHAADRLDGVLRLWRDGLARYAPHVHVEGHAGTPAWDQGLAAMRAEQAVRDREVQAWTRAQCWAEYAEGWLERWEVRAEAQGAQQHATHRASQAATKAEQLAQRQARSAAASDSAQQRSSETIVTNRGRVLDAWDRLLPEQRGAGAVGIIARRLDLSEPTVREHLRLIGRYTPREKRK